MPRPPNVNILLSIYRRAISKVKWADDGATAVRGSLLRNKAGGRELAIATTYTAQDVNHLLTLPKVSARFKRTEKAPQK